MAPTCPIACQTHSGPPAPPPRLRRRSRSRPLRGQTPQHAAPRPNEPPQAQHADPSTSSPHPSHSHRQTAPRPQTPYQQRSRHSTGPQAGSSQASRWRPASPWSPSMYAPATVPRNPYADSDQPIHMPALAEYQLGQFGKMWVCVYQEEPGGLAHVYLHQEPMTPRTWDSLTEVPKLMLTLKGCTFTRSSFIRGPWHNYWVLFDGSVPVYDEDVMHPNRLVLLEPAADMDADTLIHPQQHTAAYHSPADASHNDSHTAISADTDAECSNGQHSGGTEEHQAHHTDTGVAGNSDSDMAWVGGAASDEEGHLTIQRTKFNYLNLLDVVVWLSDPNYKRVVTNLANRIRYLQEEGWPIQPDRLYSDLTTCWGHSAMLDLGFTRGAVLKLVTDDLQSLLFNASYTVRPPPHWLWYRVEVDRDMQEHTGMQWEEWPLSREEMLASMPPKPAAMRVRGAGEEVAAAADRGVEELSQVGYRAQEEGVEEDDRSPVGGVVGMVEQQNRGGVQLQVAASGVQGEDGSAVGSDEGVAAVGIGIGEVGAPHFVLLPPQEAGVTDMAPYVEFVVDCSSQTCEAVEEQQRLGQVQPPLPAATDTSADAPVSVESSGKRMASCVDPQLAVSQGDGSQRHDMAVSGKSSLAASQELLDAVSAKPPGAGSQGDGSQVLQTPSESKVGAKTKRTRKKSQSPPQSEAQATAGAQSGSNGIHPEADAGSSAPQTEPRKGRKGGRAGSSGAGQVGAEEASGGATKTKRARFKARSLSAVGS